MINKSLKTQVGSVLLEGLVAILIFSIGILALMGLQANSIKNSVDAKYRADAAYFVNQVIGQMWVASSVTPFLTNGSSFAAWKNEMASSVPGVADCPPAITKSASSVIVTVGWKQPQESACHTFVAETWIGK